MTTPPNRYEEDKREYMRYSIFPACAIDDIEVSAECLRVLAMLGSYASKRNDYWCWTGLDKMARRIGVTPSAISQSANHLAALGYIELRHDFDPISGKQITNAYRLIMDYVLPPERDRSRHPRARAGIGGRKKSAANASTGLTQNKRGGLTQNKGGVNSELRARVNSEFGGEVNSELTKSGKYESEKLNRENESLSFSLSETKTDNAEAPRAPETPTPLPPAPTPQQRFAEWLQREHYTQVLGQSGVPVEKRIYEDAHFRRYTHLEVTTMFLASQQAPVAVRATHTRRVRGA